MPKTATCRERDAGLLHEEVLYEHARRSDDPRVRGERRRATSEAMAKFNRRESWRKFSLRLAANFGPGDIVGCVTYRDECLPRSRAEANERFRYFREKLAKEWRRRGRDPTELVVAWSTEHRHGEARWHHHFVCTALGDDYKMLRRAWIYGEVSEFSPLRVDGDRNFDTIAYYFAKESREKLGLRSWSFSRPSRAPVETVSRVEPDSLGPAPPGVLLLEESRIETGFGVYVYRKWLRPYEKKTQAPKPDKAPGIS